MTVHRLPDGKVVEASEMVGSRELVRAVYGDGSERAVGRILAYCEQPQFLIETPTGERVWWRTDMTRPLDAEGMAQIIQGWMDERTLAND